MDTQLVMGVLNEALEKYPHPEIFNTDQGSQYTSEVHTQRLKKLGITISMDGKGRATDNICIKRFWRSAKVERIYLNACQTISEITWLYRVLQPQKIPSNTRLQKTNERVSRKYKIEPE